MDIQSIKESVSLSQVAELLKVELTIGHSGPCPFCKSSKSFSVRNDRTYKCYRCNKGGSVIDFVIDLGVADNVSSAIKYLGQWGSICADVLVRETYYFELENIYKSLPKITPEITKFIEERGWDITKIPVDAMRYYPDDHYLEREKGWTVEKLKELNLYDYGREYYNGHIIFPIKNLFGKIVHFNGRAVDKQADLRWKHSKGRPAINEFLYNMEVLQNKKAKNLILCEGVTDAISLQQIGQIPLAMFGINSSLVHLAKEMQHLESLVAVFDRDRYALGTPQAGQYKSWTQVLPALCELQIASKVPIHCLLAPDWSGVTDMDEYLQAIEFDKEEFLDYASHNCVTLNQFAYDMYKDDYTKHPMLWQLNAAVEDRKVVSQICRNIISTPGYLLKIHA